MNAITTSMDMSNSMRLIAKRCFPNAIRTIDRFHIQKLACDALLETHIAHRWDAILADTDAGEEAKRRGEGIHSPCTGKRRYTRTVASMRQIPASQVCRQMDGKSETESGGSL